MRTAHLAKQHFRLIEGTRTVLPDVEQQTPLTEPPGSVNGV